MIEDDVKAIIPSLDGSLGKFGTVREIIRFEIEKARSVDDLADALADMLRIAVEDQECDGYAERCASLLKEMLDAGRKSSQVGA